MMNAESSKLRDQDLVKWIENKLGDSNELWAGRQASALLTKEMIIELETCFQALEPHVKLKIIQSISHLSPKLIQMWREPLANLIELARRDADDWVETVADMYRDFPNQACIRCVPSNKDSYFYKTLEELDRLVKLRIEKLSVARILPPDSSVLSHAAIKAKYGYSEIELKPHFTQKKNLKSQQLLADVHKASEHQNNPLNKKSNNPVTSFPIKMRSTARKPNNDLPMRGIPTVNTCKMSGGFTNEPKKFQRQLAKRDGGAMLIAIDDLPNPMSKRKRNDLIQAKSQIGTKGKFSISEDATTSPSKNSSSPIKVNPAELRKKGKKSEKGKAKNDFVDEDNEQQSEWKAPSMQPIAFVRAEPIETAQTEEEPPKALYGGEHQQEHPQPNDSRHIGYPTQRDYQSPTKNLFGSPTSLAAPAPLLSNLNFLPGVNDGAYFASPQTSAVNNLPVKPAQVTPTSINFLHTHNESNNNTAMKQFEELLKTANKLTPVHSHLIAAFLNGNKTNPLQNKLGAVVTLPLSERIEMVNVDGSGSHVAHLVETFFQMDYSSGEWKRLKKSRLLRPEEVIRFSSNNETFSSSSQSNYYAQNYAQQMISASSNIIQTQSSSTSHPASSSSSANMAYHSSYNVRL